MLRPLTVLCTSISLVAGVAVGLGAHWWLSSASARDERLLLSVFRQVRDGYVEEVPRGELVDSAIRGMVRRLDDNSAFLSAGELVALREGASGRFGGIGVELGMRDGYITVVAPLAGTPAAAAGLAAGDRVIEVDHQSLRGRTLRDAVRGLRGEPGTAVHLRVRRPTAEAPLDFDLTRSTIAALGVRARLLAPGYGYLQIRQFNDATGPDLAAALADLQTTEEPLHGLVLDLRDNPGGLLHAAVAVAETFLDGGPIVQTAGRTSDAAERYDATPGDALHGAPLAVLVNGASASASEVVAGALKDRARGTVFGTRSFGKGSVQSVVYFQKRRAIKLTTAHYRLPSGASIKETGIAPDVPLSPGEDESPTAYDERLLATALDWLRDASGSIAGAPQDATPKMAAKTPVKTGRDW